MHTTPVFQPLPADITQTALARACPVHSIAEEVKQVAESCAPGTAKVHYVVRPNGKDAKGVFKPHLAHMRLFCLQNAKSSAIHHCTFASM